MKFTSDYYGLNLCSRYSYPPNSLSLCGPSKQRDLSWYTQTGRSDEGVGEILRQFNTLYPYISFIAYENNVFDPFDRNVVEAYWLGNDLLQNITARHYAGFLKDRLHLGKKITSKYLRRILSKLDVSVLPHHAFHVTNIYLRTGHLAIPQTVNSMDACIINWGKVVRTGIAQVEVETRPLRLINNNLEFADKIKRKILFQGVKDYLAGSLKIGDYVTYHWGFFCQRINNRQLANLKYYSQLALKLANLDR